MHRGREYPPVTIRCPECGSFLRELVYAAGAFTVVACGPCGETFRLSVTWDEWTARAPREELPAPDASTVLSPPVRKPRGK
jgi:hypothetical protein